MRLLALILCTASLAFGDELLRPTTDANSTSTSYGCSGTNVTFTSFPNARDAAGLATSSHGLVTGGGCQKFLNGNCVVAGHNQFSARLFSGWPSSGNQWASLTLNVNWATAGGSLPQDNTCVAYSTNSGMTWTSLACSAAIRAQATSTATLSPTQDLTKLRVGVCVLGQGGEVGDGAQGSDDITIWDIWTFGTNNVPPPAPAPSPAALPSDPVIISRRWKELLEALWPSHA